MLILHHVLLIDYCYSAQQNNYNIIIVMVIVLGYIHYRKAKCYYCVCVLSAAALY